VPSTLSLWHRRCVFSSRSGRCRFPQRQANAQGSGIWPQLSVLKHRQPVEHQPLDAGVVMEVPDVDQLLNRTADMGMKRRAGVCGERNRCLELIDAG
jgi:hypothetical protein